MVCLAVRGLAALLLFVAGTAAADALPYVGGGDWGVFCREDVSVGGVCLAAGHLSDEPVPIQTLTIRDEAVSPVSGFYCQDFDNDAICGEQDFAPVVEPGAAQDEGLWLEARGQSACLSTLCDIDESRSHFCGSVAVEVDVNWDPAYDVFVLIDGPVFGNPLTSPCGQHSAGVVGSVGHS